MERREVALGKEVRGKKGKGRKLEMDRRGGKWKNKVNKNGNGRR